VAEVERPAVEDRGMMLEAASLRHSRQTPFKNTFIIFQIGERPRGDLSFSVAEVERPAVEDRGMMLEAASLTPFKADQAYTCLHIFPVLWIQIRKFLGLPIRIRIRHFLYGSGSFHHQAPKK
jgi:hypothetical protein